MSDKYNYTLSNLHAFHDKPTV